MHAIQYVPLILAGIILLLFGGDFLVRGGAALARLWRLPNLLVGLTIVAFGTSAPELVVSVQSALTGAPGLAVGNIVGSNIANFLLVLGLPALFGTIHTTTPGLRRNAMFALLAAIALVGVAWDRQVTLTESWILLGAIVGYVTLLGLQARKATDDPTLAELTDIEHMDGLPKTLPSILLALGGGLIALPVGAQMIVAGGVAAAQDLHVEPALIGLTAVALGTSLPELATVVMASVRRQADLAIGNVLGSNIFNVFAVGGATGMAAHLTGIPLRIPESFFVLDFWVMLGASVLIAAIVLLKRPITRALGGMLFLGYLGYIAILARSAMG
tara:strand:- start:7178 stop:8164 length:987 start_codon:yes stop_codon:yes gene_type:complete